VNYNSVNCDIVAALGLEVNKKVRVVVMSQWTVGTRVSLRGATGDYSNLCRDCFASLWSLAMTSG